MKFLRLKGLMGVGVTLLALSLTCIFAFADASSNVLVEREQGGSALVVKSGGYINVESGGELRLDGTAISSTATVLNGLDARLTAVEGVGIGGSLTSGYVGIGSTLNVNTERAISGDATLAASGALSVVKIRGVAVTEIAPTDGQILVYNATATQLEWQDP